MKRINVLYLLVVILLIVSCTQSTGIIEAQVEVVEEEENTPTNTPVPPTNTPVPPTETPIPPTATPVPPTATTEPTATLEPVEVQITEWDPLIGKWLCPFEYTTLAFFEDGSHKMISPDIKDYEQEAWFEDGFFNLSSEDCPTSGTNNETHPCVGTYNAFISYQEDEPITLTLVCIEDEWMLRKISFGTTWTWIPEK